MMRTVIGSFIISSAVFLLNLSPVAISAQTVYELSGSAFICREASYFNVYDQLVRAGDTEAAAEYERGRCRNLLVDTFFEIARQRAENPDETPRIRTIYVFVVPPPDLYIPLPGQPRVRERPDPMDRDLVQVRTIDGSPLFPNCYRCEALAWARTEDLTPLE